MRLIQRGILKERRFIPCKYQSRRGRGSRDSRRETRRGTPVTHWNTDKRHKINFHSRLSPPLPLRHSIKIHFHVSPPLPPPRFTTTPFSHPPLAAKPAANTADRSPLLPNIVENWAIPRLGTKRAGNSQPPSFPCNLLLQPPPTRFPNERITRAA